MLDYHSFTADGNTILELYTSGLFPQHWKSELLSERFFKIFLPTSLSGLELPLSEGLEVLFTTASIQGSLGWRVNLGAGAGVFASNMPATLARQIFSSSEALISGSGAASGTATFDGSHWILNGQWNYCTGADMASAFTVNAVVSSQSIRTFTLLPHQVKILNTWPYTAMKGTATYQIIASGAKVEPGMSFQIGELRSFPHYPVYQLDFPTFARFCMAASLAGLAQCFLRHYSEYAVRHSTEGSCISEFGHKIAQWKDKIFHLANLATSQGQQKTNLADTVREITLSYKKTLEDCSFRMISDASMPILRSDSLAYHAALDFWLAAKHPFCR